MGSHGRDHLSSNKVTNPSLLGTTPEDLSKTQMKYHPTQEKSWTPGIKVSGNPLTCLLSRWLHLPWAP